METGCKRYLWIGYGNAFYMLSAVTFSALLTVCHYCHFRSGGSHAETHSKGSAGAERRGGCW